MSAKHHYHWRFFRAGGFDQVKLETGADLAALETLDQKLWVALACPVNGVEFDRATLALIDSDKDGRVRVPEILEAVRWTLACLKNPDDLVKGAPSLPLSAINDSTPEGRPLLASAKQILTNLGKKDTTSISLEETADTAKIFAQTQFNGDGIVPPESAGDAAVAAVITDIVACLGAENDRSGKPGVSQPKVDQFFADAKAYLDWWGAAEKTPDIMPLGEDTVAAAAALQAVRAKIDDYFVRCRIAGFDPRSATLMNRDEKEYGVLASKDLTSVSSELAALPLAQVGAGKPLSLGQGINPAWAVGMASFQAMVIRPLVVGGAILTESDWAVITGKFAPFFAWNAAKAGASVEKLGLKRVREILSGKSQEAIAALIAKDKALEAEANSITAVEKLVRYHRDLFRLLNNFVSFRDFYGRKEKAIFQAGTLYLDQRSCELCLTVEDAGRHALMAGLAGTYLAYCDCVRKATGEKMNIVAAFTGGDSDNMMVGRNGIFYDRKGRDWDATITKIIENPISIRQAFWAPYKKVVRMIEEQIAKRAAAADAAATAQLGQTTTAVVSGTPPPAPLPPTAQPKTKMDTGTLAAIGLVCTSLLAALGGIFGAIAKLPPWQVPLAIIAILLAISIPSMVLAWLKLQKRNLGPILDANGWAINARARINVPFGGSLTQVAALPPGSSRDLTDPFAEKKSPWPRLIVFLIILAIAYVVLNKLGFIYEWTNGRLGDEPRKKPDASAPAVPAAAQAAAPGAAAAPPKVTPEAGK